MKRRYMLDRRGTIAALGSVVVGSFAGCVGGSGNGGDEEDGGNGGNENSNEEQAPEIDVDEDAPARLELVGFSVPDSIVFGDEFEPEVTLANTGGEPVEENAMVELIRVDKEVGSGQTAEVNSSDLGSGETRSHGIGPFEAKAATDFQVEVGENFNAIGDNVEELITVNSKQVATGEQIGSSNDLRLTVTGVEYEQALVNRSNSEVNIRGTLDDRVIAVPQITVENPGSSAVDVPARMFSLEGGSAITGFDPMAVEKPNLRGAVVNPGDSVEGVIFSAVPIDKLGELSLGVNLVQGGNKDARVDLGGSEEIPQFELASSNVPSQFREGDEEFLIEVENTGDAVGTFRGMLEFLFPDGAGGFGYRSETWYADPDSYEPAIVEIPPGETRTVRWTTSYDDQYDVRYRVQPIGFEWLVEAPQS
jgi:hypothetical protein